MPQAATLSLIFLDPAAGIIAGAIAGPALIALYLLRLRRRPVRISSTLLWERAAEDLQANVPLRWLRASLLLLLQLLALTLLVLALARPAHMRDDAPSGRVVLLIDRSASMAALDVETESGVPITRLELAARNADRMLRDMPLTARSGASASAMIIAFAAKPQILAPMSSDRAALQRALRELQPADQPADLEAALRLARSFLTPSDDQGAADAGTIVLFTDHDPGPRALRARVERAAPPPDEDLDNLAIVALNARRDADTPTTVRVFARILNTSREPREAPVILRVNGQPVRSVAVSLPAAQDGAPAEQGLTFDAPVPEAGVLEVEITRPDALAADNNAAAVIRAPGGVSALIVAPDARPAEAITQALAALGARAVRAVSPSQFDADLAERQPIAADLVIFDAVEPAAAPTIPSLSLGAGLPSLAVSISPGDEPDRASRFATWTRSHPVLQHVAMDSVIFPGLARVDADVDALQQQAIRVAPLAYGPSGPVITLLEGAPRRLIVGFPLERSSWWIEPGFAVFLANATEFLTGLGAETAARTWTTGAATTLRAAPGATRVRAIGPITIEAPVVGAGQPGASASLGAIERAGVYSVDGADPDDAVLAVNLTDAEESSLTGGAAASSPTDDTGPGSGARADAAPTELWSWFVLAGTLLLTLEWWLYAWRMRA